MPTQSAEPHLKSKHRSTLSVLLQLAIIPVAVGVAAVAVPLSFVPRWLQGHREVSFRALLKSRGRLITWAEFLCSMRDSGGTCIEEQFSPKGPVRFWWIQENVYGESPHEIIDWFTMRKGRRGEPSSAGAASATPTPTPAPPSWSTPPSFPAARYTPSGPSAAP